MGSDCGKFSSSVCVQGMHFENLCKLLDRIKSSIEKAGFTWRDFSVCRARLSITAFIGLQNPMDPPLCEQQCVFRVNCMDCLDRTNVIQVRSFADSSSLLSPSQTQISKTALIFQLRNIGMIDRKEVCSIASVLMF